MTATETCVTDAELTPNALLVIATLAALNGGWKTASAMTDDIGYAVGKNAAWVRRHAKAFLSTAPLVTEPAVRPRPSGRGYKAL